MQCMLHPDSLPAPKMQTSWFPIGCSVRTSSSSKKRIHFLLAAPPFCPMLVPCRLRLVTTPLQMKKESPVQLVNPPKRFHGLIIAMRRCIQDSLLLALFLFLDSGSAETLVLSLKLLSRSTISVFSVFLPLRVLLSSSGATKRFTVR